MPCYLFFGARPFAALICLILGGCLGLGEQAYPDKRARNAVQEGQSFVFFGFDDNLPDKELDLRFRQTSNRLNAVSYALVNTITGEEFSTVRGLSLFAGPGEGEFWSGVTLPPGSYFLHVTPPLLSAERTRWDWRANRYRLRVPKGGMVIYAGTLVPDCGTEKQFLSGTTLVDCDTRVAIRMDRDRARAALAYWPDARPELDVVEPEPLLRPVPRGTWASAVGATIRATGPTQPIPDPHWRRFDNETEVEREAFLSAGIAAHLYPEGGMGPGGCYGGGCVGLALLVGMVVAVDQAGKAIEGSNEKSEWSACFDNVRAHAADYLFADQVAAAWRKIKSAGSGATVAAAAAFPLWRSMDRPVLALDLYRLAVRKCREKETVCVEIALRARLGRPGKPPEFERNYVYTAAEFGAVAVELPHRFAEMPAHPWWEEMADEHSAPRHISDYCSEGGGDALVAEIDKGLAALLKKLASDLSGAGKV